MPSLRSAVGAAALGASGVAAASGPCDILAAGGTPCVAAHSAVRAMYAAYAGPLYQVKRSTDGATQDVLPVAAGGVVNAASVDAFCANAGCVVQRVYDQVRAARAWVGGQAGRGHL
jgi:non-reducing end alpha-L-arabinofuranosidase